MKIFFTVFALLFSTFVSATPLNRIVVFGDSLSDNGNLYEYMKHQLPVSPPYYEGRFTNGPVWVELLMQSYYPTNSQEHLLDYAFGGAGVMEDDENDDGFFTLRREMDSYFLTHQDRADEQSMYVVWIGANNYLSMPDDVEKSLADVNKGIKNSLQRLVDKGAQYILVVNLPDLGSTPAARYFDAVDILAYVSNMHNTILKKNVVEFQDRYPAIQWIYFDVKRTFDDMLKNPEQFGFTNATGTCYEAADLKSSPKSILKMVSTINKPHLDLKNDHCAGYLFFDPVHPSAAAHKLMAERTKLLFDENGIEFE